MWIMECQKIRKITLICLRREFGKMNEFLGLENLFKKQTFKLKF